MLGQITAIIDHVRYDGRIIPTVVITSDDKSYSFPIITVGRALQAQWCVGSIVEFRVKKGVVTSAHCVTTRPSDSPYQPPAKCPGCGRPLYWSGENLTCRYRRCAHRCVDRIETTCRLLDIYCPDDIVRTVVSRCGVSDVAGFYHCLTSSISGIGDAERTTCRQTFDDAIAKMKAYSPKTLTTFGNILHLHVPTLPPSVIKTLVEHVGDSTRPYHDMVNRITDASYLEAIHVKSKVATAIATESAPFHLDQLALADLLTSDDTYSDVPF